MPVERTAFMEAREAVLAALASGPQSTNDVWRRTGLGMRTVLFVLRHLLVWGRITPTTKGRYKTEPKRMERS